MPAPVSELVWEAWTSHGSLDSRAGPEFSVDGDLYFDGHADLHPIKDLRRASWGLAKVNEEGDMVLCLAGGVWHGLPQSA